MKRKDARMEETTESISKILKNPGVRKNPIKIKNEDDVIRSAIHLSTTNTIVPVFSVSNTTLEGMEYINKFLHLCPKRPFEKTIDDVEMHIDLSWTVPSVGTVIGGHLKSGKIKVGDKLWFGPNNNEYTQITVKSIHCKKVSIQEAEYGTYICIGAKGITKKDFKRGNVVVSKKEQQILCKVIKAEIEVLQAHSTTIRKGYQAMLHALTVRTVCIIEKIENKISARDNKNDNDGVLRSKDTATLTLRLFLDKKYIKNGSSILLCDGRTKVIGKIIETY